MRSLSLSMLALILAGRAAAQPDSTAVLKTTGAFFAVSVADLEATRAWYEQTLGLRVVLRPRPINDVSALVLQGGGLIVELIGSPRAEAAAPEDPIRRQGLFKAGVVLQNYEAVLVRLRERGVRFEFGPFPAGAGQRANFAIRDPAGTLIQFFGQ